MKYTSATRFTGYFTVVFGYFYGFYWRARKLNKLRLSEVKCMGAI